MEEKKEDTRLLRWNFSRETGETCAKYSPENPGKHITDNNPYFEIDVEKFDYYSDLIPLPDMPKGFDNEKYLAELTKIMFDTEYGKDMYSAWAEYKKTIAVDMSRMLLEERGRLKPEVSKTRENDLVLLKKEIIKFAQKQEMISGFTKLDRRYIADGRDEVFPYDTILVLGMEMKKDLLMEVPHPGYKSKKLFLFETYAALGQRVHLVADFIRSKGYRCIARVGFDSVLKFSPHAVNAGMGQFTTSGTIVTPEFGTSVRFCAINIDADIPIDHPRDLNADEFCSRCRLCQKCCPQTAIPKDEFEWKGVTKRKLHEIKCLSTNYSPANPFCSICIKVCPFNNFGYEKSIKNIPQYYLYNTIV